LTAREASTWHSIENMTEVRRVSQNPAKPISISKILWLQENFWLYWILIYIWSFYIIL